MDPALALKTVPSQPGGVYGNLCHVPTPKDMGSSGICGQVTSLAHWGHGYLARENGPMLGEAADCIWERRGRLVGWERGSGERR